MDVNVANALYFPVGLVIGAMRVALVIGCLALDAPWFRKPETIAGYLKLLGCTVTWRHPERIPAGRHIVTCNHVTVGDMMAFFQRPPGAPRYCTLVTPALPQRVLDCKHLPVTMAYASPAVFEELETTSDPSPVLVFPEGGMTNGRGMLRFSRGFTKLLNLKQKGGAQPVPVVPVALRVRCMDGVNTHTLTSSFMANLFWLCFSPRVELIATALPPMTPAPGEARGAFANRVQAAMAEELGVKVYDMTIQQKKALMAKKK
ncbi:hypothetical protein HYH03_009793 [Edaphochlamys debaryana]|uniref:Phospholipid/glycerol acyltransferase domain-containing protein n=1 Tax=Edaphochlamys debaryana TaxID=47281 RepID=A0A835XVD2_9CHLO|nr:hypothetical protein HYH03_009793 [Edaphochlamys debaryana]|eukprot:KAG2491837.1 hypothetical protein HYH03_009793 [Edaphochlamys debaryana]